MSFSRYDTLDLDSYAIRRGVPQDLLNYVKEENSWKYWVLLLFPYQLSNEEDSYYSPTGDPEAIYNTQFANYMAKVVAPSTYHNKRDIHSFHQKNQ